jgi:hypothetical protein
MAQNPTGAQVHFDHLAMNYGAVDFQDALAEFIAQVNHPGVASTALQKHAHDTLIPFNHVPVFHKIKFTQGNETEIANAVHVWLEQKDLCRQSIPARFDTVLVKSGKGEFLRTFN